MAVTNKEIRVVSIIAIMSTVKVIKLSTSEIFHFEPLNQHVFHFI